MQLLHDLVARELHLRHVVLRRLIQPAARPRSLLSERGERALQAFDVLLQPLAAGLRVSVVTCAH